MSAIPRNEGEKFEDYVERRLTDAYQTKKARKGALFHDSFNEGTYVNHGEYGKNQLKKTFSARQLKKKMKQTKREET